MPFHAFDYITKPFSERRLFQVLDDAQKHFPKQTPCINIVSGRQTIPLLLSDIVSVVNDAHYLDICTKDGKHLRSRMTAENFGLPVMIRVFCQLTGEFLSMQIIYMPLQRKPAF
jgi:DNA-binding LytR/AlgR family response regulator